MVPGKLAWVVNVDLVCLNYDGSVLDCCIKALVATIRSLRLFKAKLKLPEDDLEADLASSSLEKESVSMMTAAELREAVSVDFTRENKTQLEVKSQPVACTVAMFEVRTNDLSLLLLYFPGNLY